MVDSMITLFDSTSTDFSNNGLGNLPDAISCLVTEERNGKFELEMEYPISGKRYGDILLRRIIMAKPNPYDNPQPFRIYSITKPINGVVTVNAEHISYDLSGYPVEPFTADTAANSFHNMKEASAVLCPFSFNTDKTTMANMKVLKPSSMRSLLGGIEGSILDVYGGEYKFDKFNVYLFNHRGMNRGVSIRYGKNLTDLEQEENCSSVFTGVYPFWYSEQDGLVQLPEKYLNSEGTYNFTRIYPLDLSQTWQDKPTEEQLRVKAQSYMNSNGFGIPKVSLSVSFIQLAQSDEYKEYALLEAVHLCDTVNVEFPELNVSATAKCITTVYDTISEKYAKIELGSEKSNLASTIADQEKDIRETPTKTFMEQAIENATKLITGGLGGYVVLHSSTSGNHPDEILVMDTDDILTAVNIWRWNKNGLGHSSTGYNGPFTTAMTADGAIVGDVITAGTINGALIRAGSIEASSLSLEYRTSVEDDISGVRTTLEQEFAAADGQLLSRINLKFEDYPTTVEMSSAINQKADEISLSVTASSKKYTDSELSSVVTMLSNKISLVVSDTSGGTVVNSASIIAAINDDESTITLNANKINLTAYSTTTQVTGIAEDEAETAVKNITLSVVNGESSSSISLGLDGIDFATKVISFTGVVKFTDLETSGMTTINGSNITTGSINASLITVGQLDGSVIKADSIETSAISIDFKNSIDDSISDSANGLRQEFTLANGELRSSISEARTYAESEADTAETNAKAYTDDELLNRPTKTEMTSAITQKANEISLTVSETRTYAKQVADTAENDANTYTNNQLTNYPTTYTVSSSISQLSNKISLVVSDSGYGSTVNSANIIAAINNDGSSLILSANKIDLSGTVTFNSLSGYGTCTINGNNITAGSINADLITTGTLNASLIAANNGIYLKFAHPIQSSSVSGLGAIYFGENAYIYKSDYSPGSQTPLCFYAYSGFKFMYQHPYVRINNTDYTLISSYNISNYIQSTTAKFG